MESIVSFSGTQKGKVKIPWSIFVGAFVVNLGLFGERLLIWNLAIASATLVVSYGGMLFMLRLMGRFISSGFTLNDEVKHITTSTGRSIPYEKVKRIDVHVTNDTLYVSVHTGGMRKIWLYSTANLAEEQRLVEEFKKRFSNVKNRTRAYRNLNRIAPVLSFAIPLLILGFYHLWFYQKHPELRVFPTVSAPKALVGGWEGVKEYTFNGVTFFLPDTFGESKEEKGQVIFWDKENGAFICVDSNSFLDTIRRTFYPGATAFFPLIGLSDEYDFLKVLFYSRVGLLPLALKLAVVPDCIPDTTTLLDIEKHPFKGFLLIGDRRERIRLWLVDKEGERYVNFTILSEHQPDETIASMLIEGAK